jgi:hypothetical protein
MRGCGVALGQNALSTRRWDEPPGIYIDAYTDAADSFAVFDLVSDWLVDLRIQEGIPLHVIPLPAHHEALAKDS